METDTAAKGTGNTVRSHGGHVISHYLHSNENVLASEVAQMFCLVPTIIDMLLHQSDPGEYM